MKAKPFSYRPSADHARRLNDLILATEHDKTLFIDKALEAHLPALEARYSRELSELRAKRKASYTITPANVALNDAPANPLVDTLAMAKAAGKRAQTRVPHKTKRK
jgi:hypothetical protein